MARSSSRLPLSVVKAYLRSEVEALPDGHGLDRVMAWTLACWRARLAMGLTPHREVYVAPRERLTRCRFGLRETRDGDGS